MNKEIRILIAFIICHLSVYGQQQVMFTQYMFNQLALNPAYAGIHEGVSTSFLARNQWVGFDGAPQTQTLSIHSPINYNPIALGAVLIRDRIGVTDQFGAHLSFAYRIGFENKSKLSFGLQASVNQYQVIFTSNANNDPNLVNQNINEISPNVGAGIMWHSEKFYLGFSVPQLITHTIGDDLGSTSGGNSGSDPDAKLVRHYFLTGGYVFELNESLKLKPNILMKWVQGAPFQIDLNANFLIKEIVWLGISYRSFESFDVLFQLQITQQFQFGYAYDFLTTTELSRVNNGSHEFMINFVFNRRSKKVVSPRYF